MPGSAVARFILQHHPSANRIAVVCGKGNNGGDGFVVARNLHRAGRVVEVLLLASRTDLQGDALTMFERLPLRPIEVTNTQELQSESSRSLANCDLLVDAILGTGFKPPVTGLYAEAISLMNRSDKPVIAVDIPSGADSDAMTPQSGHVMVHSRCHRHFHSAASRARLRRTHARTNRGCTYRLAIRGDRIQPEPGGHHTTRLLPHCWRRASVTATRACTAMC